MRHVAIALVVLAAPAAAQPAAKSAILAALIDSAAGWNAGDLDRFMAIYADDPATSYVVRDGIVSGKAAIAARYAPRFAPGMADKRGALSFDVLRFVQLDTDHALLIARYRLRIADGKQETGPTSLIFQKTPDGWKIIADHSS